jgi:hypothetical protein
MTDREISEIIDDCLKCKLYRHLETQCLKDISEYSCSDETREAIEDMDPTGRKLEEYCTNEDEREAFDLKNQKALHEHVLSCDNLGCTDLRAFRKSKGVSGY